MIQNFFEKHALLSPPQSVADNSTLTSLALDTYGYEYAKITVNLGVTDLALAGLKVQQSDLANMATPIDVPGTHYGTDNNDTNVASVLPGAADSNHSFAFFIDLRGKKRYLQVVATTPVSANNTALLEISADLGRPHESPLTAVNAGYAQRIVA
jgi:hypothetical protein